MGLSLGLRLGLGSALGGASKPPPDPPIPTGFTLNAQGFLVQTSDGSLWRYVKDGASFVTDSSSFVLQAA